MYRGEFRKSAIKVNKDALLEYGSLNKSDLFFTIKRNAISGDTVTVPVHNAKALPIHVGDIVSDNRIINNNVIGFTETQIKPSASHRKIIETLKLFNINSNNNNNNNNEI